MKAGTHNRRVSIIAVVICLVATVLVGLPVIQADEGYPGEGKDQLVQALDGAIARIIDSGQWRAIVKSDPVVAPLVVNIGDCYPRIEDDGNVIYPFPSNPVGLLKEILDSKQIRIGDYDVNDPFVPGTFHIFDTVNPAIMRAIIDELGKGYGIPPSPDPGAIQIVPVYLWPPSSALMFEGLNSGDFDIIGFNAALGATVTVDGVEKRRRDAARFTCTVFGTNWYIHVRNDSSYQTIDDVIADTTARLCVGQLSSRLSGDYFKNAADIAKQFTDDDLLVCSEGVRDGTYDAYLHFDPVPVSYPPPDDLRSIPMQIVSGIPIWVAGDSSDVPVSQPCVSEEIYGDHADETELLRKFRDDVLSKTPAGQEIISLYYQWSPIIVRAMRGNKSFTTKVQAIIDGILPLIEGGTQE
jgi:ABC-type amino acid transport substrate-binding protein